MKLNLADRVKETTTTTGTGAYALAGAAPGHRAFTDVLANADVCCYAVSDGTAWEVGVGTFTAVGTSLSRDRILASSNGNAAVNWGAGSRDIWIDYPAALARVLAVNFDPLYGVANNAGVPNLGPTAALALCALASAVGNYAIAIGLRANANGASALAIGGDGPSAVGDFAVAVGGGSQCQASALRAVAIGGDDTSDTGAFAMGDSSVAVGARTKSTGIGAACIGGGSLDNVGNVATGRDAACLGGSRNTAAAVCSAVVGGRSGKSHFFGSQTLAGGDAASTTGGGACQSERTIQRKTTTDATVTALEFDASAATLGYLTLPANFAAAIIVHVVGRETATGDAVALRLEGLVHTDGTGAPSLIGTTPAAVDLGRSAGAVGWAAALAVDGVTNKCLLVNVTGQTAKTIKWVARIELVEVGA
ncbi:MAG: hypothetical protein HOQ02_02490 [Lysobacter sp.]|nr:hypothetical protein [Lysobacter sp.]